MSETGLPTPAAAPAAALASGTIAGGTARTLVLFCTLLACVAITALTAAMASLHWYGIDRAAQAESHNLARAIAYGMPLDPRAIPAYVAGLDELYRRDIVVVDARKKILDDLRSGAVGATFDGDVGNEVGETIADGRTRHFISYPPEHPDGLHQTAVPLYRGDRAGPATGAVVLDATPIRNELRAQALPQLAAAGLAGLVCVVLVAVFGARLAGMLTRLTSELQASNASLAIEREKERRAAEHIEFLAYHDKLTGLPNRSLLSRTLAREIVEAQDKGTQFALVFVDLDRFKNVNDTLGHEAGDQLLQETARRLKACVRAGDLVARLGGDEFVVLLAGLGEPSVVGPIAQKVLAAMSRPMTLHAQELRVTASLGISVYPADGADEPTLMKHADIAMYQVKEDGKNDFAFFRADLNRNSLERLAFEASLRRALDEQQFEVHYQPKIDCKSGAITGVEALLRWPHPDLGMIPPTRFIPVAEETGLIVELGRWVLQTVCRQHAAWRDRGLAAIPMAVNLSARQFSDDRLLDDVRGALEDAGMAPAFLELEITESMLMRDVARATRMLEGFKALGIRLSVDDFGTGYSSLSNLKCFPVDTIKIDRSFIRDLSTDEDDRAIADAIISMGRTLSLTVVAEGVETAEQAEFLRLHGCDEFQGFYASKAVPPDELRAFAEERQILGLARKGLARRGARALTLVEPRTAA